MIYVFEKVKVERRYIREMESGEGEGGGIGEKEGKGEREGHDMEGIGERECHDMEGKGEKEGEDGLKQSSSPDQPPPSSSSTDNNNNNTPPTTTTTTKLNLHHQNEAFVHRYAATIHPTLANLPPAALDGYLLFHDLCLLTGGEVPVFLRLEALSRTFGLELMESVLGHHFDVFRQVGGL